MRPGPEMNFFCVSKSKIGHVFPFRMMLIEILCMPNDNVPKSIPDLSLRMYYTSCMLFFLHSSTMDFGQMLDWISPIWALRR